MSTMGTNIAQSVAGTQQAQQAASPRPVKGCAAGDRKAIRTGDQVELSTELIDAVNDAANTTDEQPRQQQHPHHPKDALADGTGGEPPHIDVQA